MLWLCISSSIKCYPSGVVWSWEDWDSGISYSCSVSHRTLPQLDTTEIDLIASCGASMKSTYSFLSMFWKCPYCPWSALMITNHRTKRRHNGASFIFGEGAFVCVLTLNGFIFHTVFILPVKYPRMVNCGEWLMQRQTFILTDKRKWDKENKLFWIPRLTKPYSLQCVLNYTKL